MGYSLGLHSVVYCQHIRQFNVYKVSSSRPRTHIPQTFLAALDLLTLMKIRSITCTLKNNWRIIVPLVSSSWIACMVCHVIHNTMMSFVSFVNSDDLGISLYLYWNLILLLSTGLCVLGRTLPNIL